MIRTVSHAIFRCTDLAQSRRFYEDFGLTVCEESDERVFFRGAGTQPYIFGVEAANRPALSLVGYEVRSEAALEAAAARFNAPVEVIKDRPGGGRRVTTQDCDGNVIELVWGAQAVAPLPLPRPEVAFNSAGERRRLGRFPIFEETPTQILRLCHVVHASPDPRRFVQWYVDNLGAYPSDYILMADDRPFAAFIRFPDGKEFVDHHNVAVAGADAVGVNHTCFEVLDTDAVFMGHRFLEKRNYAKFGGPLRHSVGGAISDYWFDPDGFQVEHVTDGDCLNDEFETGFTPFSERATHQWSSHPMPAPPSR
jgi:catechol 2,3-dioxygenase-like lactoylglutathione lyase family enzyme